MTKVLQINLLLLILIFGCKAKEKEAPKPIMTIRDSIELKLLPPDYKEPLGKGLDFAGNGKDENKPLQEAVFKLDTIHFMDSILELDKDLRFTLKQNIKYLKRAPSKKLSVEDLNFSHDVLIKASQILLDEENDQSLNHYFDAYKIHGEDQLGHVHYTSYFTPILEVSDQPDSIYKYPIYEKPKNWKGKLPSKKEIDGDGVLKGKGLEICWAKSNIGIHFMQVQGSGYAKYPDGTTKMLKYGGKNGHSYRSIGRYLVNNKQISADRVSLQTITKWLEENPDKADEVLYVNASYVFFYLSDSDPSGAASVPITALYTVAADKRFLPLGSIMVGRVPILDVKYRLIGHEYRILVAQDTGGAIKGAGHIDLYAGSGEKGKLLADAMHHYGNLWLLLPKRSFINF